MASVPVLAGFAWYQVRRSRSSGTPLVEPGIFRHRSYASSAAFSLVFVGSMGGIVLVFNVVLQAGLGFTPWAREMGAAPVAANPVTAERVPARELESSRA